MIPSAVQSGVRLLMYKYDKDRSVMESVRNSCRHAHRQVIHTNHESWPDAERLHLEDGDNPNKRNPEAS